MNNLIISDEELADNPTARVPICILLDVSRSMDGEPIKELNKGVKMFINEIQIKLMLTSQTKTLATRQVVIQMLIVTIHQQQKLLLDH